MLIKTKVQEEWCKIWSLNFNCLYVYDNNRSIDNDIEIFLFIFSDLENDLSITLENNIENKNMFFSDLENGG